MPALAIALSPSFLQVAAGSSISLAVEIRNLGTVVDRYRCEIVGLDPTWFTVTPTSVELFPQRDSADQLARSDAPPTVGRFTVSVHPPRTSAATAGQWPIGVKVTSEHDPGNRLVEEATLNILPFGLVEGSLRPMALSGRLGASTSAHVTNRGNRPETITVTGTDPAERIDFEIERPIVTLQPGQTAQIPMRLTSGGLKVIGGRDNRPFTVDLRAGTFDTAPVLLTGTFERHALIPSGIPIAVTALSALTLAGMAVYAISNQGPDPSPTASPTPSPTASPTASPTPSPTLSPTLSPTPSPTSAPQFQVTVTFKSIKVLDDADPVLSGAGEVWLSIEVNGQTKRWPTVGTRSLSDGDVDTLDVEFSLTLSEDEALAIEATGTDDDDGPDDPLGVARKTWTRANDWGSGTHTATSTKPDGQFKITYTVEVTRLNP
jgi:hypothetical protein